MPAREYLVDGDQGFVGLNSKDNPLNLGKNYVAKSTNFRLDRGVAILRKGIKRITDATIQELGVIYGACTYTTSTGVEYIILVLGNKIIVFNQETQVSVATINFPNGETITASDRVDVYQAQGIGHVYICRGFDKSTLRWNGTFLAGSIQVPSVQTHHNYPNTPHAIYYGNRHIVQVDQNTIRVSHYLADNGWSALDMFSINDGSSDTLVGITPWTLNEFVIFMRNSIMYASVGVGAFNIGDQAQESDSYIKSLAVDIGCIAKRSILQAGGAIIFLSDNGVYMLNPQGSASGGGLGNTPEGTRILTLAEPLSATISDVISRINYNYVQNAVAAYWENRYYLAVPLDNSSKNNAILVYNFINKSWESVDTYPSDFNIKNFVVSKLENRRRIFAIDEVQGIFLMEQLEWDEYGGATGSPLLPLNDEDTFVLDTPSAILNPSSFKANQIQGELITRAYSFETNREKRFSGIQVDTYAPGGGVLYTNIIVTNPDTETELIRYGVSSEEGTLLRLPVRKCGQYVQARFLTTNMRPSIYSTTLSALVIGYTHKSQK